MRRSTPPVPSSAGPPARRPLALAVTLVVLAASLAWPTPSSAASDTDRAPAPGLVEPAPRQPAKGVPFLVEDFRAVVAAAARVDDLPFQFAAAPAPMAPVASFALPAGSRAATAPPNTDLVLDFHPSVTAPARQAMTAAAGIWSDVLLVRQPIRVRVVMENLPPGYLGAARPGSAWSHPWLPEPHALYPVALFEQYLGGDVNPGEADIEIILGATVDWDHSLDPGSKPSLVSVAVHEIGHGLGLTSGVRAVGGGQYAVAVQDSGMSLVWDWRVVTAGGSPLPALAPGSLASAVTSNQLWWSGSEAAIEHGGSRPRIHAPSPFESGSSVAHLDEATHGDELMTPETTSSERHFTVSALTRGLLRDIGWTVHNPGNPLTPADRAVAFVRAVVTDFLGRTATEAELATWAPGVFHGGARTTVTNHFAYSDEWIGAFVAGLYQSTLGRVPDPGGLAYWIGVLRSGVPPALVASHFYASQEYFLRSGSTVRRWVTDLYTEILGRQPDAGGLDYWEAQAGVLSRPEIALPFYQSVESRRRRVAALYHHLLGRGPDAGGLAYWAEVLANGRDLELALFLAASDEYLLRAAARYP